MGIDLVSIFSATWGIIKDILSFIREKNKGKGKREFPFIQKRFEVYQEAYSIAEKLKFMIHRDEEKVQAITEAQDWFAKNCLYLDADIREKYRKFIYKVWFYRDRLKLWKEIGQSEGFDTVEAEKLRKEIEDDFEDIVSMQDKIQKNIDR